MTSLVDQLIEVVSINSLTPYPKNARTHSDTQVQQIASSIEEFGFTNPILVAENQILAGHGRHQAALLLGLKEVPVIRLDHLSESQRRAYILADNKIALNADWNVDLLASELSDLQLEEFDTSLIGFSHDELEDLLAEMNQPIGSGDENTAPELPDQATSKLGDLWIMGPHRLLCGDCTIATNVAHVLNGMSPNLMATDPPYGVEYNPKRVAIALNKKRSARQGSGTSCNDNRADWTDAWKLFSGRIAYVWHAALFSSVVSQSLENAGLSIRQQIIWSKNHFSLGKADYHWMHEPCWYAVRSGCNANWIGGRDKSTVWEVPAINYINDRDIGNAKTAHPTQKPIELYEQPYLNHTTVGESVYEPFAGSGSAYIAAHKLNRVCLGLELDPRFVDAIVMRWQNYSGQDAILESSGQTFEEVRGDRA